MYHLQWFRSNTRSGFASGDHGCCPILLDGRTKKYTDADEKVLALRNVAAFGLKLQLFLYTLSEDMQLGIEWSFLSS
jgi:hypothetical protein